MSGPKPFRPPSNTSTADSVEASGTANPGEPVTSANTNRTHTATNMNAHLSRPVPTRPWLQQSYGSTYGSLYGVECMVVVAYIIEEFMVVVVSMEVQVCMVVVGCTTEVLGVVNWLWYGNGMGMSPYGGQDPKEPFNQPPSPPGFWISFLRVELFIPFMFVMFKKPKKLISL
ncbi:unnamed protein product [Eruca vesicaria subsp. sativa]|uniref:Peroxin-13 n=1 Tax=Eruca vesicaria subsp. sativa TaxID=29727 RepID=A0ABC8KUT0_ERUVS|nr:unnamed protein product [Eruca vesicaria subsp. sativa]